MSVSRWRLGWWEDPPSVGVLDESGAEVFPWRADADSEEARTLDRLVADHNALAHRDPAALGELEEALSVMPSNSHYGHFDAEGTAGRNCPACMEWSSWHTRFRAALARFRMEKGETT